MKVKIKMKIILQLHTFVQAQPIKIGKAQPIKIIETKLNKGIIGAPPRLIAIH